MNNLRVFRAEKYTKEKQRRIRRRIRRILQKPLKRCKYTSIPYRTPPPLKSLQTLRSTLISERERGERCSISAKYIYIQRHEIRIYIQFYLLSSPFSQRLRSQRKIKRVGMYFKLRLSQYRRVHRQDGVVCFYLQYFKRCIQDRDSKIYNIQRQTLADNICL